jgi:hypothetical protein
MSDLFEKLSKEYPLCGIVKGTKKPHGNNASDSRGWNTDPLKEPPPKGNGLGIICGSVPVPGDDGIFMAAFDVDALYEPLASAMRVSIHDYLEASRGGKILYRYGLAPKFIVPVTTRDILPKKAGKIYYPVDRDTGELLKDQKCQAEFIGKGQFVAYGIHRIKAIQTTVTALNQCRHL